MGCVCPEARNSPLVTLVCCVSMCFVCAARHFSTAAAGRSLSSSGQEAVRARNTDLERGGLQMPGTRRWRHSHQPHVVLCDRMRGTGSRFRAVRREKAGLWVGGWLGAALSDPAARAARQMRRRWIDARAHTHRKIKILGEQELSAWKERHWRVCCVWPRSLPYPLCLWVPCPCPSPVGRLLLCVTLALVLAGGNGRFFSTVALCPPAQPCPDLLHHRTGWVSYV